MSEGKKIDISVLLPTRGRVAGALRAIESMKPLGPRTEILVGADEDDETLPELRAALDGMHGVRVIASPRHVTLGALFNHLYSLSKGRYVVTCPDDYVFATEGWQKKVLEATAQFKNDIGIGYLCDPTHPMFTTFPVLSRKTVAQNIDGEYINSMYPFWFGDTCWDEIGDLLGIKVMIDVEVRQVEGRGKTQNLRDLYFWSELFHASRPVRGGVARKLAELAYAGDADGHSACIARFPELGVQLFDKTKHLMTPDFIKNFEGTTDGEISPRYAEAKARAEAYRETLPKAPKQLKVAICTPSTGMVQARTTTSLMGLSAYTAQMGIGIMSLSLEGSMITKSRNDIVDMALKECADYIMWIDGDMIFPPDTIQRLLAHGKDIVGATYCKRVPPFEVLGKIFPHENGVVPSPEEFAKGGLYEAGLMPGGIMLIKTDVFRKIPRLWYWESYKSPGATGVESLKEFLRYNFASEPPKEALDSLEGTKLAEWLDFDRALPQAYGHEYFSEDYNFCRKARRNGFRIFCDLSLTFALRHVGVQEVAVGKQQMSGAVEGPLPMPAQVKAEDVAAIVEAPVAAAAAE